MKQAKLIFTFLVVMLIGCSYSVGQSPTSGVRASYYPIGQVSSSGIVSLGDMRIDPIYISHMNFICDIMASCGLYPASADDIKTGTRVYPTGPSDIKIGASAYPIGQISNGEMIDFGGIRSGETLTLIDNLNS